ncbi:MetQ/NlpA family ABC transporter substrate-binding protein [Aerococcus sp. HMSC10H05]|uniref:MetQ/NlpA family ABC transporter substrate-binding protein n=1 Tax=Aerococcus sp. HMSC10H05 TaxID=1581084 RepID=UPI0008A1FD7C|nr:MetQ/NlpA family ABC transporter substrate-binding protein [Aerococcus sp. HMSC10H05]OFU50159.1 hypothetical protein HMPREF3116_05565 [Aerococcus sp. HMSC10H05]
MKFGKLLWVLLIPFLVACGMTNYSESANNDDPTTSQTTSEVNNNDEVVNLKVGVVSSITEDIWTPVAERLAENGSNINLDVVLFSDFTAANTALAEGEIDLNNFQYIPFMYTFNQEQNSNIRPIAFSRASLLGQFASDDSVKTVDDIPEHAEIGLNDDAVSIGYIFNFLDAIGLITLDDSAGTFPTEADIISNPKKNQFTYMPAAQLPRSLVDLDLAVSSASYFVDAGLTADDAIALEDPEQTPPEYFLSIAVRGDELEDPNLQTVVSAYMSPETDEFAKTVDTTYTPVWAQNIDANQVYENYAKAKENQ